MRLTKPGYYADFVLYPVVVAGLVAAAVPGTPPADAVRGLAIFAAALFFWTLIEYLAHRYILHHWPVFRDLHDAHHEDPKALVGTPSWVSALMMALFVLLPMLLLFDRVAAAAATAGVATGYFWYVTVHHATHRWDAKRGSYLYRVRLRHARHHYAHAPGNYGVTTDLWDHVFGTVLDQDRPKRT